MRPSFAYTGHHKSVSLNDCTFGHFSSKMLWVTNRKSNKQNSKPFRMIHENKNPKKKKNWKPNKPNAIPNQIIAYNNNTFTHHKTEKPEGRTKRMKRELFHAFFSHSPWISQSISQAVRMWIWIILVVSSINSNQSENFMSLLLRSCVFTFYTV